MKTRVAIVGYGNLGKAVETEVLASKNLKLVAIFSRRAVTSKSSTLVEFYDKILAYKGKVDVLILCGSSANDIEWQLKELSGAFSSVNSFDTHSKLSAVTAETDQICKASKTVALTGFGWDPGLFSVVRTLMFSVSKTAPVTFWGRGISMGHSDAIRRVENVIDGVQFTVPNKEAVSLAKLGKPLAGAALHHRECYVLTGGNKSKIEQKIRSMPNYFKGQPVSVRFVSAQEMSRLKAKASHKGKILCGFRLREGKAAIDFGVKMTSNAAFTAKILVRAVTAVENLKRQNRFGAFLPIDIAAGDLLSQKEREEATLRLC